MNNSLYGFVPVVTIRRSDISVHRPNLDYLKIFVSRLPDYTHKFEFCSFEVPEFKQSPTPSAEKKEGDE